MKIVAVGDNHGRTVWKEILKKEKPDKFIFIGDYFDSRDGISAVEQLSNFKDIAEAEQGDTEIIRLFGNHDMYIYSEMQQNQISGYQSGAAPNIQQILQEYKDKFQMCHRHSDVLFTHAGVSIEWLTMHGWDGVVQIDEFINELWKYKPLAFKFNGTDVSGDNTYQTPIWIRPRSLIRANNDSLEFEYRQIVGHTTMNFLDIRGLMGGRYFFIDTLGTSGEYLIIENGEFKTGKYE